MVTTKEKEVLLYLVELYKEMPYLWDKSNIDYTNKDKRQDGFMTLLEIYKGIDENATIPKLKKRIENMRANYSKEKSKVYTSMHSGAVKEDIYKPTLWYYEAFKFLETRHSGKDTLGNEDSSSSSERKKTQTPQASSYSMPKNNMKRKISILEKHEDVLDTVTKRMATTNEEKCEIFGKCIGLQLKDIDSDQLIIVQKLISDTIFYARTGKLSENSCIDLGSSIRRESVPTIYIRHNDSGVANRSPSSNLNYDDCEYIEQDSDEQS